jgi:hypothetical protein
MSATTFRDLYDNPGMDPYKGLYSDVLSEFVVSSDEWDASDVFNASLAMEPELANAYVGLFEDSEVAIGVNVGGGAVFVSGLLKFV